MPVIKGHLKVKPLGEDRRNALITALSLELAGKGSKDGPVIFEIPLDQSDRFDVIAVWQEFHDLRSEDRTDVILKAYGTQVENIAQALGVTFAEAMDQGLLPYRLIPIRPGEANAEELATAMRSEGSFFVGGEFELRFPTQRMAIEAIGRLSDRLPRVGWHNVS